jgi:bacterioferritin
MATTGAFLTDVETLRRRAREHIELGPITDSYGADRERVIAVLNEVLATELVCVLRYKRHYFTASGPGVDSIKAEFLQHAGEEAGHADRIAERSHAEYKEGTSLTDMVKEDLIAERVAVASYSEIIRWLGEGDPTTTQMIKNILAVEEEHADDMLNLLKGMG